MDAHLRAGIAIYNAGEFHAAHDAWEEPWLDCERDTPDERLLHGLIQFTAAIHHATEENAEGATGLATSAREYLKGLDDHRGVNLADVRGYLAGLASEPRVVEHVDPPALTVDRGVITLDDCEFEAGAIAARVLADEHGYDEGMIERAVAYGRQDLGRGEVTSPFVTLVLDFARDEGNRPVVANRLREHTERRETRDADLDGLFDQKDRREND